MVQLDENIDDPKVSRTIASAPALPAKLSPMARRFLDPAPFDGGDRITGAGPGAGGHQGEGAAGRRAYVINGTELRSARSSLASGASAVLEIDWSYNVPENSRNGRGVREQVKDGWLYEMAQWYPRAAVYDDVNGGSPTSSWARASSTSTSATTT